MKKTILSIAALSLIAFSCKKAEDTTHDGTTVKDSTTAKTETAPPVMDSAAMMKAWKEYATPGEVHKVLAMDTGKWDAESLMWEKEGATPMKSVMKADIKMSMDGKYQVANYTGTMMDAPFQGEGIMGFNNASGKVESTWRDNMSTGMMLATGDYDASTKTFNIAGEMADPVTKQMRKFREKYTIVDNDTRKMEMFDTPAGGKEYKSMEITLKRTK